MERNGDRSTSDPWAELSGGEVARAVDVRDRHPVARRSAVPLPLLRTFRDAREVDDALIADEHDDEACACDPCGRERSRARVMEAIANGGFASWAKDLFGPDLSWVDEDGKGGSMEAPANDTKPEMALTLARSALSAAFDHVAEIARVGGNATRTYAPDPLEWEAACDLLDQLEKVTDFARAQLHWLPTRRRAEPRPLQVGDRVIVRAAPNAYGDGRFAKLLELVTDGNGGGSATVRFEDTTGEEAVALDRVEAVIP